MFRIVDGLTRLLAPILPVTAEELWRALPGAREPSVHLATFAAGFGVAIDRALLDRWTTLLEVRAAVNGAIERLRQRKEIGQSLEVRLALTASGAPADTLGSLGADELAMLFIVSKVDYATAEDASGVEGESHAIGGGFVRVEASRAGGEKCPRCWRYVPSLVAAQPGGQVCDRCAGALAGLAVEGAG
jgi:isoleucyl-tRNA synthetase